MEWGYVWHTASACHAKGLWFNPQHLLLEDLAVVYVKNFPGDPRQLL